MMNLELAKAVFCVTAELGASSSVMTAFKAVLPKAPNALVGTCRAIGVFGLAGAAGEVSSNYIRKIFEMVEKKGKGGEDNEKVVNIASV